MQETQNTQQTANRTSELTLLLLSCS